MWLNTCAGTRRIGNKFTAKVPRKTKSAKFFIYLGELCEPWRLGGQINLGDVVSLAML
jgi:hypothetical protein